MEIACTEGLGQQVRGANTTAVWPSHVWEPMAAQETTGSPLCVGLCGFTSVCNIMDRSLDRSHPEKLGEAATCVRKPYEG